MRDIYEFDEQFLKETIKKGEKLLADQTLSKKRRGDIEDSIKTFQNFLNEDYELYPKEVPSPKNIHSLKNQLLQNMRFCYNHLGEDAITWMLYLADSDVFTIPTNYDETELSMDEQVSLTLRNYEKVSPAYLHLAQKIIGSTNPPQIHEADYLGDSSYVHDCAISHLPFIIIDTADAPWIFNHEIQHAIESLKRYKTNLFYTELGSQFMELPFLERIYEYQGFVNSEDYASRVVETQDRLTDLKPYLQTILLFAKKDFIIPTDEFIETFADTEDLDEEMVYYNLLAEYIDTDKNPDIYYTISYLKAIELYEHTMPLGLDAETILKPYLKRPKFNYQRPEEGPKVYEKFLNRMEKITQ